MSSSGSFTVTYFVQVTLFLQESAETIPLHVPRIGDEHPKGMVPRWLQKQDLQIEELNGPTIPVKLAGSKDCDDANNASSTDDRNKGSEKDVTSSQAVEGAGLTISRGTQ